MHSSLIAVPDGALQTCAKFNKEKEEEENQAGKFSKHFFPAAGERTGGAGVAVCLLWRATKAQEI